MMREIKFRAWDLFGKQMVYTDDFGHLDCSDMVPFWKSAQANEWQEIMQYTGLKDKNGKEIYEGDIVKYIIPEDEPVKDKRVIFWREDTCGFQAKTLDSKYTGFIQNDYIEIIGNIYENLEMLSD
ncbi:hypothetical protein LCGC14_1861110 [marine sediment metagenome]|uniref:YopX protein domain-containing protein n=1 Tax=marine sediment metagenome TaxID=412755 RepID=A0A0F9GVY0_9ZZZZ